ncbi:MAG: hypothetical protein IJN29_05035 [Akkermansia sp.]|nr:hypothetical protein [Akkermansia sp.]
MKKIAILAAGLLCAPLAMAQDAAPVLAPAPAPAAGVSQAELDSVINELVQVMTELVEVFESVTDKETADAAAEKLMTYKTRMEESEARFDSIGTRLSEEQQMLILQKVFPLIMSISPRMEAAEMRIEENAFYGSEALKAIVGGGEE